MRHTSALLTLAAVALVGLGVGCPDGRRGAESGAASLASLDSSLARFVALDGADEVRLHLEWGEGGQTLFEAARRLEGWEEVDGVACARVVTTYVDLRRSAAEWLRPAGDRVLCVARSSVGPTASRTRRLVPPQPILVAPLEAGRTWTWSGLAGDVPVEADFRILHVGEREGPDGEPRRVVEVEQTTRSSGLTSTRVQTWAEGRGLVAERGTAPTGDVHDGLIYETKLPRVP